VDKLWKSVLGWEKGCMEWIQNLCLVNLKFSARVRKPNGCLTGNRPEGRGKCFEMGRWGIGLMEKLNEL